MSRLQEAWFGAVPSGWETRRLRTTVLACQNGLWGDEPSGENDLVCVRVADFDRVQLRVSLNGPTFRSFQPAAVKGRLLQDGDLLLEKSGGGDRQPVGAVVLYDLETPAVCSNFIARMPVARGHDSRFLTYLHAAAYAAGVNQRSIKQNTGIQNLDSDAYLSECAPIPPLHEQRAIGAFLDSETTRIDALIAKKERLVALLEEKRTALITRAVTKGLDPAAPMKESGVEWLGEVPAHWEVVRVKSITTEHKQGFYTEQAYADAGVKLVRITDIDDHANVSFADMPFVEIPHRAEHEFRINEHDFLFARSGTIGRFGVVRQPERAVFASYLIRFRFDGMSSEFLRYAFASRSFREGLLSSLHGGANQNVHAENIKEQWIPVPPAAEQSSIAAFLSREGAKLDALAAKVDGAIALLREYRSALISAAVTGKIDVPGAGAAGKPATRPSR